MARLQRKKTASAKKKKKQGAARSSSAQMQGDAVAKKTPLLKGSGKDVRKKHTSPQKKALTVAKKEPGKLKGYVDKSLQFLREVKVELKKVTWPRKQTLGSTVVVLILVMIISLFLGVIDIGLSSVIRVVLK